MGIMQLLNLLLFGLFFGFLSSHFAKKKGRNPLLWFFLGLFLGIFGVILALFIPKKIQKEIQKPLHLPKPPQKSEAWLKMWYYLDPSHQQQGPFEFPDFIKKWKDQGITERSFVWGEGMQEWKPLAEMPDLMQEIKQA